MTVVVLDTGVLMYAVTSSPAEPVKECKRWLSDLIRLGIQIAVPEIADYELRRLLLQRGASKQIERLDFLNRHQRYLPLSTASMRRAAENWAAARRRGRPTAASDALDGDVILGAQVAEMVAAGETAVIATTNVQHLAAYGDARAWREIVPASLARSR